MFKWHVILELLATLWAALPSCLWSSETTQWHTTQRHYGVLRSEESVSGILSLLLSATIVPRRFSPLRRDEEQVAHVELRRLHFAHRICRHRRDVSEPDVEAALDDVTVTRPQMLTAAATAAAAIAPIFNVSRFFRRREEKRVILQRPKAELEMRFPSERQFMMALLLLEVILLAPLLWRCKGRPRPRSRCKFLSERGHALEAVTEAAVRGEEEGLVSAPRPHGHRGGLNLAAMTTECGGSRPDLPLRPRRDDQVVQFQLQLPIPLAARQPRHDIRLAPAHFHRNRFHLFRVGKLSEEGIQ